MIALKKSHSIPDITDCQNLTKIIKASKKIVFLCSLQNITQFPAAQDEIQKCFNEHIGQLQREGFQIPKSNQLDQRDHDH